MRIKRGSYDGYGADGRKLRWRLLIVIVVVGLVGFLGYRKYVGMILNKANMALAEMRLDDAAAEFERAVNVPFAGGRGLDGQGVVALMQGDPTAAKTYFDKLIQQQPGSLGADPEVVFKVFIEQGRYDLAEQYRDILATWKSNDLLERYALDLAVVAMGNRDLASARAHLTDVDGKARRGERFATVETRLNEMQRAGQVPVMVDRRDETIVAFDLATQQYRFTQPRLFAGWSETGEADAMMSTLLDYQRLNLMQTTLDLDLQRAALEAMGSYQGTMILLDPITGDILAAVGTPGYDPFNTEFEPGSIIKLLTYGFFYMQGSDTSSYVPKDYPAALKIGGRIFYDWTTHGQLNSIDEGMAVSCNLMFAQMGVDMGWPLLRQGFEKLFDGQPVVGYWGQGQYGRLVAQPQNAWEIGRAAIGLDFLRVTSLGAVMIPHAIANGGVMNKPRLVRQLTNVEGDVYLSLPNEKDGPLFSEASAEALLSSMEASMVPPKGTARRAAVPFANAAMKTGTAGESPFDSIMVGVFPVEKPKIAFSLFLHKGGKCERHGALVAKRLQEQIRALAPQYLER